MKSLRTAPKVGTWLAAALLFFVSVVDVAHTHAASSDSGTRHASTDAPCAVCAALHAPAHLVVASAVVTPDREVTIVGRTSFLSPALERIGELPARSPPQAS